MVVNFMCRIDPQQKLVCSVSWRRRTKRFWKFFGCSGLLAFTGFYASSHAAPPKPRVKSAVISLPQPYSLKVGQDTPDFDARDMNGTSRNPRSLHGRKNLLLTFFPKCFTFNCKNQLMSLRDSYDELQKADVVVWGVSVDPPEGKRGQKAFAQHLKLPYPLIPDTKRQICLLYATVQSTNQMAARTSVLIDKEGKVRWIDKQVDPRTHGFDVLTKMRELEMTTAASAKR